MSKAEVFFPCVDDVDNVRLYRIGRIIDAHHASLAAGRLAGTSNWACDIERAAMLDSHNLPVDPTSKVIVLMAGAILKQAEGTADNRDPDWPAAVETAERAYAAMLRGLRK